MVTVDTQQSSPPGHRRRLRAATLAMILIAVVCIGCKEQASDDDIAKMCTHLTQLRGKPNDHDMRDACIAEAKEDKVSKKQALCRIYAVNKQEYWIRCRTGEPRPPQKK